MTAIAQSICPGCGLTMPVTGKAVRRGYYNTSDECWDLYTEVLAVEYSNALIFGQVHQLTVDTYAVQHPGAQHPDKSIAVHLFGLHFALEKGVRSPNVPPLLQRVAGAVETWPHFPPPSEMGSLTVCDVALCGSVQEHIDTVRAWARTVWECWSSHHTEIARIASQLLSEV